MARLKPDLETFAKIKVVGVGGGGNNAITRMVSDKIRGVEFIAINTDAQDLHFAQAQTKIHIGKNITRGLGAGMDPDLGRQAAEESREEIQEVLKGADLVFVTCGLGGGTGTGASPVVADIARSLGALTIGVITKPFTFEGAQRTKLAEEGMLNLKENVDALVVIPNDRIFAIIGEDTSFFSSFEMVDNILKQAVQGISDLITLPGIINVDFNDVKTIMQNAGSALMGIGIASGEDRAEKAAKAAINSPLLELSIEGARGVLFNISGGADLGMMEIHQAAKVVTDAVDPDARIIFGAVNDPRLKKGELKITVIAAGFGDGRAHEGQAHQRKDQPRTISITSTDVVYKKPEQKEGPGRQPLMTSSVPPEEKKPEQKEKTAFAPEVTKIPDDGWDIPAFIRRKKM
ncbi:MAG: cell division protein FtsZ [Candidatus Azambacteria bacterium]|nr:cell division protein FtsZ [Candidatus Azambacteria bacterium]